nr:hypothetical protein [Tanacetum cinerariifolium]
MYPSDFEDLNLLLLQGYLDHLLGSAKWMLSTAVKLWTRNLVIRKRVKDFQLGIESYQTQLNLTKPRWDATGYEFKHDYTIIKSPREALAYRVKEFKIKWLNPGMNTRFWTQKYVTRIKEATKDEKDLPESGMLLGFNPLVHSLCALSTLRRFDLRTASAAAKPCQGDSLEVYLIIGSIYTDQQGTVVLANLFNESEQRHLCLVITKTYNIASTTLMLAIMIRKSVSMPVRMSQLHMEAILRNKDD